MAELSAAQVNLRLLSFLTDTELWHQVMHGSKDVQVKTDGGPVASVARIIDQVQLQATSRINTAADAMIATAKEEMRLKMLGVDALFEQRVVEYLSSVGTRIDQAVNQAMAPHLQNLQEMITLAQTMTRKTVAINLVLPNAATLTVSAQLVPALPTQQIMGVALVITAPADATYDFQLFDGNPATTGKVIFHARMVTGNYVDRLPFYAQVPTGVVYARLTNQAPNPQPFTANASLSYLLG